MTLEDIFLMNTYLDNVAHNRAEFERIAHGKRS